MKSKYLKYNIEIKNYNDLPFYKKSVEGLELSQSSYICEILDGFYESLLTKEGELPKTIIEIGTYNGAFSILLGGHKISEYADIYTFDIADLPNSPKMQDSAELRKHKHVIFNSLHINFILKDCFKSQETIKKLIQNEGKTLLFCDGGHKIKEFNTFAKFLKKGDHIFAHDFSKDKAFFEQNILNKYWKWHEISESDISSCINNCNLQPYMQDLFYKSSWASFIKV